MGQVRALIGAGETMTEIRDNVRFGSKADIGAVTTMDDVVAAAITSDLRGLGALRVAGLLLITIQSTTGILGVGIPDGVD